MKVKLNPLYLDLESIEVIKKVLGKLFKNRMSGFIILSEKNMLATNTELTQIEGNALTSSDSFHLVDIKNEGYHEAIAKLLCLNSEDLFAFINRDKLFKFLSIMEKFIRLMKKESNFSEEEKRELFSFIPLRYINGEIVFDLSDKAKAVLNKLEGLADTGFRLSCQRKINDILNQDEDVLKNYKETGRTNYDELPVLIATGGFKIQHKQITNPVVFDNIEGLLNTEDVLIGIHENKPKYAVLNQLITYNSLKRKTVKLSIAESFSYRILTHMIFIYSDHVKTLHPDGETDQFKVPIQMTNKDLILKNLYSLKIPKQVNTLFKGREEYTGVIPIISGINHPVPASEIFTLSTILWKEDQSIRHLYIFDDPEFHVTSFLPQSTLFLLESERKKINE